MTTPSPQAAPGAPTTLVIARHGQSEWNNRSLVTGQLDPGLSDKGRQQGAALAQCLQDVPLDAIYTSALRRTHDTARPTASAKGLPLIALPALNEIHLGVLQGRHRDERDPEAQALWARWQDDLWHFRVPGGERFDEFTQRVDEALQQILRQHAGQCVLIVAHRATNRVLLGTLLDWPRERWVELRPRNKYAYRVRLGVVPEVATYTLSGSASGTCADGFVM